MKHRKDGYIAVYLPGNPMAGGHGYVLQHRLVMSQQLGRPLGPREIVHHKDGNRKNNDPSNLELLTPSAHQKEHWRQVSPGEKKARMDEMRKLAHTPEARAKMSRSRLGNQHRKGKPHSAEVRAKISAATTGKKRHPLSDELKQKLSAALKGRAPTMLGRKHSEETKRKISEAARLRSARRRASLATTPRDDANPPGSEAGDGG